MNFIKLLSLYFVNKKYAVGARSDIKNGGNSTKEQSFYYYNQV